MITQQHKNEIQFISYLALATTSDVETINYETLDVAGAATFTGSGSPSSTVLGEGDYTYAIDESRTGDVFRFKYIIHVISSLLRT